MISNIRQHKLYKIRASKPNLFPRVAKPSVFELTRLGLGVFRRDLGFLADLHRRRSPNGEIIRFPSQTYLISHPEDVEQVLGGRQFERTIGHELLESLIGSGIATTDGETWRPQRKALQPYFQTNQMIMKELLPSLDADIDQMLNRWETLYKQGETIDLLHELRILLIRNLGNAFFKVDLSNHASQIASDMTFIFSYAFEQSTARGARARVRRSNKKRLSSALNFLWESVDHILEKSDRDKYSFLAQKNSEASMNARQLRDSIMTFLFTGFSPASLTLTWAICFLSQKPKYLNTLREEARESQRASPLEAANDSFAAKCLREAMRLRPPVPLIARRSTQIDKIGGIEIPKDAHLTVFSYGTHRLRESWERPDDFYPEHFDRQAVKTRHSSAFIPFGGGRHTCIARSIAMIQMQRTLHAINRRFQLKLISPSPDKVEAAHMTSTLTPRHSIWITPTPLEKSKSA